MRVVVYLQPGADVELVKRQLFKLTRLEVKAAWPHGASDPFAAPEGPPPLPLS